MIAGLPGVCKVRRSPSASVGTRVWATRTYWREVVRLSRASTSHSRAPAEAGPAWLPGPNSPAGEDGSPGDPSSLRPPWGPSAPTCSPLCDNTRFRALRFRRGQLSAPASADSATRLTMTRGRVPIRRRHGHPHGSSGGPGGASLADWGGRGPAPKWQPRSSSRFRRCSGTEAGAGDVFLSRKPSSLRIISFHEKSR